MSESNTQPVFKSKWMLLGLLAIALVGILVFASPDLGEDTSKMGGTIAEDEEKGKNAACGGSILIVC